MTEPEANHDELHRQMGDLQRSMRPCPFCGSDKTAMVLQTISEHCRIRVHIGACTQCGARGPISHSDKDTIAAGADRWDRRSDNADVLRETLMRVCAELAKLGFHADECGGPEAFECIKELGDQLAVVRSRCDDYQRINVGAGATNKQLREDIREHQLRLAALGPMEQEIDGMKKAANKLAGALGNPALDWTQHQSVFAALIAFAIRRINELTGDRAMLEARVESDGKRRVRRDEEQLGQLEQTLVDDQSIGRCDARAIENVRVAVVKLLRRAR